MSCDDIREVAVPVLRHRMVINFHGQSEDIADDQIVREILAAVKEPNAVS